MWLHMRVEGFVNAELHLGVYEKELLAVIHALTNWKHYLLGANFVMKTDHQILHYFLIVLRRNGAF